MIVAPPGEPRARNGLPLCSTIVGEIDERGRLPPVELVRVARARAVEPRLKSVSSLLSRNP